MLERAVRRRTRLVNKSLQYRFLAMILIYSAIFVLFFALVVFVPDIIQMRDQSIDQVLRADAAERILSKHVWVWPIACVIILIMSFHSFRSFYRVVGPLHRFHAALDDVASGEVRYSMKIRAKDYLSEEAETLDEMLRVLTEKLGGIQQTGEDALKSLKELENHATRELNNDETYQALIDTHHQHLERLMQTARYFHIQKAKPATVEGLENSHKDSI
jgi:methyl-accepting chemotaxis protein